MKKKFIYSVFAASVLGLAGCESDFLEPVISTQSLTQEQLTEAAANNPEIVRGTINGIYSLMVEEFATGTEDHTDFGSKSFDIFSDMLSGDMALTNNSYNWYRNFVDYQVTTDFTRADNVKGWNLYYNIIKSSNSVIATLGGNDFTPENEDNKVLMGQAKALRGYAYFYLAQLYAREYDSAKEILPIYTEPGLPAQPKSPTSDVYTLIISDLTDAIELLDGFARTQKHEINASVAKGLLAYTYGAMGQYADVKTVTNDIITTGGFPLTTTAQLTGGFNDVTTPSWMWGYDIVESLGIDLVSWWGQMDLFTYSYQWAGDRKSIDITLYNSIPVGDVRRNQFAAGAFYMPVNKFFHPNRVQGGQRTISTDYIYMRVDEMYLLNAEAAAKTGDEAGAKARLIEFLANRVGGVANATTFVTPLTGAALEAEIYKQTRIEFWGEGKSYLAMKRNKATINRGPNHLFQAGVAVPYNDPRLTFKIPQVEILNNPFIKEQN